MKNSILTHTPSSAADWRNWLQKNHVNEESVWLIYFKKASGKPTVSYSDAVDEALCFGWIDSKIVSIDEYSYKQYFCKRKPTSVWSKVNKAKIQRLIEEKKMTKAGLNVIEIAKANGSWHILDEVEAIVIPQDLQVLLNDDPIALENFTAFSKSVKRNILQWVVLAKRPQTRLARMNEIVQLAKLNQKPKQF